MNRIEQVFGRRSVLLPVIHPIGWNEALASVRIVHAAGVKGIFLIDQGMNEQQVLQLVREIRGLFPSLWVGVNLLGRRPIDALLRSLGTCDARIDGIWSDNAGVDERAPSQAEPAEFSRDRSRCLGPGGCSQVAGDISAHAFIRSTSAGPGRSLTWSG